jgi:hypothetical protein
MSYLYNHSKQKLLFEEVSDISSSSTFKSGPLKDDKYFILHHTAGRGNAMDVMNILNNRKLGVQWVIDRDGKLFKTLPSGHRGAHIKSFRSSVPKDLNNRTSQGVEIIAKNDSDISITQCRTALKLIKSLGYPMSNIYGHGEVSTNKSPDEGKTCKGYIKKYWSTPESKLPGSDAAIGKIEDKKGGDNSKKDSSKNEFLGFDLDKITGGLKDAFAGLFTEEELKNNKSNKNHIDVLIEREIKKLTLQKLNESNTYGFEIGKVDSGKVVKGGEDNEWGGSMERALEIAKIASDCLGKKNIITSQKRSRVKTASGGVSDHYIGNLSAYAVDIRAKGETGDELLACIMKKWNGGSNSNYKGGKWLNVNEGGYRYQFGWRVPDHYDHIHVGVRKKGGKVVDSDKLQDVIDKTKKGGDSKDSSSIFDLISKIGDSIKDLF